MRGIIFATCIALAGCSPNKQWFPGPGGSAVVYGKTAETIKAEDDATCREYGFERGTDAYGNCRLKLDEMRALKEAGNVRRNRGNDAAPAGLGGGQGLSLLCKDALARGDQGGAFVHC